MNPLTFTQREFKNLRYKSNSQPPFYIGTKKTQGFFLIFFDFFLKKAYLLK